MIKKSEENQQKTLSFERCKSRLKIE